MEMVPLSEDTDAAVHPALERDLEYGALLRSPALQRHHLARERRRVRRCLQRGGWGFSSRGGLALVQPLAWDTRHFGVRCADLVRLYTSTDGDGPALLAEVIREARARGVVLLSLRLIASDHQLLHAALTAGARLVDTSVELGGRLEQPTAPRPGAIELRAPQPAELARLEAIAETFVDNRFHRDPRIAEDRARGVYRCWVRAAAEGSLGDLLVAARPGGSLLGLCSYHPPDDELDVGVIGLLVLAAEARGRGLMAPLVAAAARRTEAGHAATSTQLTNTAALRGFARLGLLPYSARHILHLWLDPTPAPPTR